MAKEPYIYTTRLDVRPEGADRLNEWADNRHLPDVLETGFLSAVRFRCIEGQPEYLQIYEIPSLEIFQTPAYRHMCRCDPPCESFECFNKRRDPDNPEGPQILRFTHNTSRGVYEQVVAMNTAESPKTPPGRHSNLVGSIRSDCVYTVRLDLDTLREEEFIHWLKDQRLSDLLSVPGFISARVGRNVDSRSNEPEYLILLELKGPQVMKDSPALNRLRESPDARRMRSAVHNRKANLAVRIFPRTYPQSENPFYQVLPTKKSPDNRTKGMDSSWEMSWNPG